MTAHESGCELQRIMLFASKPKTPAEEMGRMSYQTERDDGQIARWFDRGLCCRRERD